MGSYGELFPGRKLRHEGDQGGPGREHDPGGPLDLDRGVVYLAPPERSPGSADEEPAADDEQAADAEQSSARAADERSGSGDEDAPAEP